LFVAFRVAAGRAKLVPVSLGHSNGLETEVLAGLASGDRLTLYPGDRMKDGVAVFER
jgi:HlyD family secretion protein